MANIVNVTDDTFDQDILKSGKTVVVDFWVTWCGPCKMVAPVLDEIAGENSDKITVAKLDIDQNTSTARDYQGRSIFPLETPPQLIRQLDSDRSGVN
jgi:thioredoxin 1